MFSIYDSLIALLVDEKKKPCAAQILEETYDLYRHSKSLWSSFYKNHFIEQFLLDSCQPNEMYLCRDKKLIIFISFIKCDVLLI